ncbi:MAG TPA: alpha/beta fold hydrolase, partial [Casimicrobiaceae bacterium]
MTAETAPPAAPDAVFLIHGLGGTQYDLGSMHKRLKNAGFVTHSLTLPGHGTQPEDLANVTAEDWIDAVVAKYREVRDAHPTLHLMGMCMGALLAAVLAERERHAKGRLVLLAPPVFIDGWATPWYRELRPLLYAVPGLRKRMKIEEEEPYGIKNEQLRAIVKAKFERGENFHYRWVPLECLRQVDRLRAVVMKAAPKIACPTLVVHAREDELTSLRSANFLVEKIGGGRARMVVLEDSYHMVCVDNDKEIVARNVLEFFGAAMPGATSILANEPRMTADELAAAVAALTACLE